MNIYDEINEENFELFAIKYYDNPVCLSKEEFEDDVKRFKYLKKLFFRYIDSGELKERLILNHIIILFNVFGDITPKLLFYKMSGLWSYLVPFLKTLNRLPQNVYLSPSKIINTKTIMEDSNIADILRKI